MRSSAARESVEETPLHRQGCGRPRGAVDRRHVAGKASKACQGALQFRDAWLQPLPVERLTTEPSRWKDR